MAGVRRAKRPAGAGAVMAGHAPAEVEADDPQTALFRRLDFFPTPCWAARAGAELLLDLDPSARSVAEPACGEMHIAGPLADYLPDVRPSDVYPYSPNTPVKDWLDDALWREGEVDWVMTNPPFSIAHEFVTRGLARARRGVAILVRGAFIESDTRYGLHYNATGPLALYCPFAERVPMALGKWDLSVSTATAYAWMFYLKGHVGDWRGRIIPPGTRDRLWSQTDVERYAWRPPLTLFEDLA